MWSAAERAQIAAQGTSIEEVERQLELFRNPPRPVELVRPCAIGDGIRTLAAAERVGVARLAEEGARQGRMTKFVPASGAASRMFQALLAARGHADLAGARARASAGDHNAAALVELAQGLPRFAFVDDLRASLRRAGLDLDALAGRGELGPVLDHLLGPAGLDYAALPKGLLKFHTYAEGARTPFEEHLVEAAGTVRGGDGATRLHFTVSPEHRSRFDALLEAVRSRYEQRFAARFEVGFSVQKPATDTIAADLEGRPFRDDAGRLLFRPGGHGALIENLADLGGDVVYIKNIDNVVPEHLAGPTLEWKRALGGLLLRLQGEIFRHLERLSADPSPAEIEAAARFAAAELALDVAPARAALLRALERPLRVCGVVPNTGEPGGGPFWVRAGDGGISPQIVESAQVGDSPEQRAIFAASTHFNPVDLVCGLRDRHGQPFDLRRHVDESAVFIARKSSGGRELQALERPGLWNGAMADWITVFVEVPIETFNPVKTVLDLLRPQHQPPARG